MPAIPGKPVMARRRRVVIECRQCGAKVERRACEANRPFCSKACFHAHKRAQAKCKGCGAAFARPKSIGGEFCSRECAFRWRRGKNHAGWKGGVAQANERARNSGRLLAWKRAVKARDKHRCRECGGKDRLHAHHIKPWAEFPDLRFDLENGKTLCEECHSKVHGRWVGKGVRRKEGSEQPSDPSPLPTAGQ